MDLYIQQKVFSWADDYSIYDADRRSVFQARGEVFSWGARLHMMDMQESELYFIQQKVISWLPTYHIFRGEQLFAEVRKRLTFLRPKLDVSSQFGDITIDGSVWEMDFTILWDGRLAGTVSKQWLSWGDTYWLNIADSIDPAFFASLVLVIDHCLHNEDK